MQCEVLIVLVANLTVVVVLMRTGLRYVFVTLGIFVKVVIYVFCEIFIVFSFPLLLDLPKFFGHELSFALIDDRTKTIWCGSQIKTENVKFGLERLLCHFPRKTFWSAFCEFLRDRNLISAPFSGTHTCRPNCRTGLYRLKLVEHLLVGHVELVVMFVQIKFAYDKELTLDVLVLRPFISLAIDCVQSGFVERGKL